MPVPPLVLPDAAAVGETVAELVLTGIRDAGRAGRPYVLGCPSGRTPEPVYAALVRRLTEAPVDLGHLVLALMDDYAVPAAGGYVRVDEALPWSCVSWIRDRLLVPLTAAAQAAGGRGPDLWAPDPADPEEYERQLARAGGVEVFLLASGAGDGHIAFNPQGSPRESRTRVIELAQQTRLDNMGTFPMFAVLDDVPRHGISVGIGTICDLSRSVVMIVTGRHKHQAFTRLAAADRYEPDWPATAFVEAPSPTLVADAAAAGTLPA